MKFIAIKAILLNTISQPKKSKNLFDKVLEAEINARVNRERMIGRQNIEEELNKRAFQIKSSARSWASLIK